VTVREGPVRQFWPPQVYQPATRVAEPLLAIETSDFERRSKEAEDGLSRNSGAARRSGVGRSSQLLNEVLL